MPRLNSPAPCRGQSRTTECWRGAADSRMVGQRWQGLVSGEEEDEKTTGYWLILCAQDHQRRLAGAKVRATVGEQIGDQTRRKGAGEKGGRVKPYQGMEGVTAGEKDEERQELMVWSRYLIAQISSL
ncbi:hypothetical protein VZT92_005516 [Zoarces viviparus]|uniref:Uncharacterized protein n=1 Tax=Zoarces viviparus TaxID=48416 RepID=A0AAW1FTI9_ZOAVI